MIYYVIVPMIKYDEKCPNCGSWLNHWEKCRKKRATKCSVLGCNETENLQGTHVISDMFIDNKSYIIPLCKAHTYSYNSTEIEISTTLISPNPRHSCKRF